MTTTPVRTRSRYVEVVLMVVGIYSVVTWLFMMLAPGHSRHAGNFGPRNDHYIFDNATFELPLGLLLVAAVRWPTWRVPALAFATLHWELHASVTSSTPTTAPGDWVGLLEFGGLALTTVLLAIALRE